MLFLLALVVLVVAIARPTATVTLPSQHETIILAMDVSGSMRATDVAPSRIVAAQNAARAFVADQPASARIGVVSFAATASVVQPPTRNREEILAAIDRFQLQRGTAIGSGILVALKTIFPDVEFDLRASNPRGDAGRDGPLDKARAPGETAHRRRSRRARTPTAAIVLLTDGQTTTGPNPIEAARMAADRGVRIYTVGIGTANGEILGSEGWSMRVRLDEDALKTHRRHNARRILPREQRRRSQATVYQSLNTRLCAGDAADGNHRAAGRGCGDHALFAAFLSMLWFNRIL